MPSASSAASDPTAKRRKTAGSTAGFCPALQKSIEKWSLLAPYSETANNDLWSNYYAERSALEFRHGYFFVKKNNIDDDDDNKKPIPQYERCYGWRKPECKKGDLVDGVCPGCQGVPQSSPFYGKVQPTEDTKQAWTKLLAEDEILQQVYGNNTETKTAPPLMKPHCTESYAEDCHPSGSEYGEFDDFNTRIRERVTQTLEGCSTANVATASAKTIASGLFILDYYANYEETGTDAQLRTVEFGTRIYTPIGNGQSIDLHWYRHYRQRMTMAPENYSNLVGEIRELSDCSPEEPDRTYLKWRKIKKSDALAVLDGDTKKGEVRKTFVSKPKLAHYRVALFGDDKKLAKQISNRKVFGLLARASGAHIVREEGGWVYFGMRKRFDLLAGEESDGEEDGPEDGPSGCIIC